jgi:hypothetical protein
MKRITITIILFLAGMTVFSQDMSSYTNDFMRTDGTFTERLLILEAVRDAGLTGIGDFYYNALKYFLLRSPDIATRTEQEAAEKSAIILCDGLGAEKYTDAAEEIWQVAELFDVARDAIDGGAMRSAMFALGQVNATAVIPRIVQRLNNFNTQSITNPETRRRVQMVVVGCINALEALHDIAGYRPVFFVSVGTYDPSIREIAATALPNIVEDPGDVLIAIIQDPSITPPIKLTAWNEMLKTSAPNTSKARVAAAALATSFVYFTSNRSFQGQISEMRKGAIDIIRQYGVSDDSVYANLEKTYSSNFINNNPDYDEIMLTLNALAAIKSDEAVELLRKFLNELHGRRRNGPWGNKERRLFEWVISCIAVTGTQSADVRLLLTTIQRTNTYTAQEQRMAENALRALGGN